MLGSILLLCALLPEVGFADSLSAINQARALGCSLRTPLTENHRLAEVARLLARGGSLESAQKQAGYQSARILSVQLSGVTDDHNIGELVSRRLCSQPAASKLRELGTYRRGSDIWIALAEPFIAPDPRAADEISRRLLELTNEARSQARRYGSTVFPAAPAVVLDPRLMQAARAHSLDMARWVTQDVMGPPMPTE
jgi:hypothetical protein